MPQFSPRALLLSATLLALSLAGCGGGSSGSGGVRTPNYNGPSAPELPAIPRVIGDGFTLSPLFADHAVLQRDRPLQVWGTAVPGEAVTVTVSGRAVTATAQNDGRWLANLGAFGASGATTLTAKTASGQTQTRGDILFGDVWLCSGQSNMEMSFEWNVKN